MPSATLLQAVLPILMPIAYVHMRMAAGVK